MDFEEALVDLERGLVVGGFDVDTIGGPLPRLLGFPGLGGGLGAASLLHHLPVSDHLLTTH